MLVYNTDLQQLEKRRLLITEQKLTMKRERHLSAVLFIHLLTSKIMFAQIVPRLNISLPPIKINTGNKPFTFSGTPIVSPTGRMIGGTAGIDWKPAGSNTGFNGNLGWSDGKGWSVGFGVKINFGGGRGGGGGGGGGGGEGEGGGGEGDRGGGGRNQLKLALSQ